MSILFEPISIGSTGSMVVKNRFVRSATNDFMGNKDGSISDRELDLYKMLAANDVGLIITGQAYVQHPAGKAGARQNAIFDDRFIEGYRKLADTVHEHGAKLVMQVSHAGRQSLSALKDGVSPVAPSAVTDTSTGITPRELTVEEIWQ
ncbi:MAG: NADH:flavin oxidoreductase, partial [Desulfotomaculaceae bacterium]|nr:NADH:flavin oxidoreductase [Desulfotomaculaceae bacterium]